MRPELEIFLNDIKDSPASVETDTYEEGKKPFLNNASDMLEVIKVYPEAVLDLPHSLMNDREFITSLIKNKPTIFNHFESIGHYEKSEFTFAEVGLACASTELRNDREFVENCLRIDTTLFFQVGDKLLHNIDFLKKSITNFDIKSYQFLSHIVLDSDFAKDNLELDPSLSRFLDPSLCDDIGFLLEHKSILSELLVKSTDTIKNNEEIMLDFCRYNFLCAQHLSEELKDSPSFLKKLINLDHKMEILEIYNNNNFSFISNPFVSDRIDSLIRATHDKNPEFLEDLEKIEDFFEKLIAAREKNFPINYQEDFYSQFNYHSLNTTLNKQETTPRKPKI